MKNKNQKSIKKSKTLQQGGFIGVDEGEL